MKAIEFVGKALVGIGLGVLIGSVAIGLLDGSRLLPARTHNRKIVLEMNPQQILDRAGEIYLGLKQAELEAMDPEKRKYLAVLPPPEIRSDQVKAVVMAICEAMESRGNLATASPNSCESCGKPTFGRGCAKCAGEPQ